MINCIFCNKEFKTEQYNKKYCSSYCQKRSWNLANKQSKLELQRIWRLNNPSKIEKDAKSLVHKIAVKRWKTKNKQKVKEYNSSYRNARVSKDLNFKIRCNIRSRLSKSIKKNSKSGSAVNDLGCSIDEFKLYLESKFEPWMNWDNYGPYNSNKDTWQIDHIVVLANFDLTNRDEFIKACNYKNMQPMLASKNMSKGSKNE